MKLRLLSEDFYPHFFKGIKEGLTYVKVRSDVDARFVWP
ncbi:hypothetical protein HMPREF9402_0682 [Turicibacter sp. HGF1]|nr:hypothetical protein HMPREF9402_0682 [Turicibacter sp. HGF1]